MTDADRARLAAYLRILADRMGLKDWTIEVLAEWADDGNNAEVWCVTNRKLARVKFSRDWREWSPEDLRRTCVHELLHCHMEPAAAHARDWLKASKYRAFVRSLEYGVDGIADGWAPCLPLMLSVRHEGGSPMGRQKTKPAATVKAPQAKPKAGPKPRSKAPAPAPKGAKPGKG